MEKQINIQKQQSQIEEIKKLLVLQNNIDFTKVVFEGQASGISEILDGIRNTITTTNLNMEFQELDKSTSELAEIKCKLISCKD